MSRVLKDPASGLSHLAGAVLSVVGLAALLRVGIANHDVWQIVSFAVFGGSLILLYSASATYHLLNVSTRAEVVLRKLDHIMIFVLIAGTYTPVCLVALRGPTGYAMLAVIWSLAVAGVFFKAFYLNAPRWAYTGIYLLMGWICVFAIVPLARAVGVRRLLWLFAGAFSISRGSDIRLEETEPSSRVLGFHEISTSSYIGQLKPLLLRLPARVAARRSRDQKAAAPPLHYGDCRRRAGSSSLGYLHGPDVIRHDERCLRCSDHIVHSHSRGDFAQHESVGCKLDDAHVGYEQVYFLCRR